VVKRSLLLMRHAEALDPVDARDFNRPLSEAGRGAAQRAAQQLVVDGWKPQLVLYSPALRTLQTTEIVCSTLDLPTALLQADSSLYLATPETLRTVISRCDTAVKRLALIGHNPAVSQLLAELSPCRDRIALATAEFRLLELPIAEWSELQPS
jgi:phosphohistidine phosphatase